VILSEPGWSVPVSKLTAHPVIAGFTSMAFSVELELAQTRLMLCWRLHGMDRVPRALMFSVVRSLRTLRRWHTIMVAWTGAAMRRRAVMLCCRQRRGMAISMRYRWPGRIRALIFLWAIWRLC
jgi:hypothetical protein